MKNLFYQVNPLTKGINMANLPMNKINLPEIKKFFRAPDYIQLSVEGIIFHGRTTIKSFYQIKKMMSTLLQNKEWRWSLFWRIIKEAEKYEFAHAGNIKEYPGLEIPKKISVKFIRELLSKKLYIINVS